MLCVQDHAGSCYKQPSKCCWSSCQNPATPRQPGWANNGTCQDLSAPSWGRQENQLPFPAKQEALPASIIVTQQKAARLPPQARPRQGGVLLPPAFLLFKDTVIQGVTELGLLEGREQLSRILNRTRAPWERQTSTSWPMPSPCLSPTAG